MVKREVYVRGSAAFRDMTMQRSFKVSLNARHEHWEKMLMVNGEMFGRDATLPARKAAGLFKKERRR